MVAELDTTMFVSNPGCVADADPGFELHCSKAACVEGMSWHCAVMLGHCHICSHKGSWCLALCCTELQVKSETAVVKSADNWKMHRLALVNSCYRHTVC